MTVETRLPGTSNEFVLCSSALKHFSRLYRPRARWLTFSRSKFAKASPSLRALTGDGAIRVNIPCGHVNVDTPFPLSSCL